MAIEGFAWFRPDDLPRFFEALRRSKEEAILVGGQSLTFWVDFFGIPIPDTGEIALTQDADVFASKQDAEYIAAALNGTVAIQPPDDPTPNTAIVTYHAPYTTLMRKGACRACWHFPQNFCHRLNASSDSVEHIQRKAFRQVISDLFQHIGGHIDSVLDDGFHVTTQTTASG